MLALASGEDGSVIIRFNYVFALPVVPQARELIPAIEKQLVVSGLALQRGERLANARKCRHCRIEGIVEL